MTSYGVGSDDHLGRHFSAGPRDDNDASFVAYGPALPAEPQARAVKRAAGVGPLSAQTYNTPLWVLAER